MKLDTRDIKTMVLECIERFIFLNEAKASDVYNRFYADSIPQEMWVEMTKGTENITPFHRKVADIIKKAWANSGKNQYDKAYFMKLCRLTQEAWNSSQTARQFLTNAAKEDYYKLTYEYLEAFLKQVMIAKNYSENEFIDNGLYKLYEDDDLLVTVTLSYSASHKHYGDSHWCTASDIAGNYNGFEMFKNYTTGENPDDEELANLLLQFVDKHDRYNSYQVQTDGPEDVGQICDFMDNSTELWYVGNRFGSAKIERVFEMLKPVYNELSRLTSEYVASEDGYYNLRDYVYITHRIGALREKLKSPNILEALTYDFNHREEQQSGSFLFLPERQSLVGNKIMCNVRFKMDVDEEGNGDIDRHFEDFATEDDWNYLDDNDYDDDFDDDFDDDEDEDNKKHDPRPVGKGYLTPEELTLLRRAYLNRSYRFTDLSNTIVLFEMGENLQCRALKVFGGGYFEQRKDC